MAWRKNYKKPASDEQKVSPYEGYAQQYSDKVVAALEQGTMPWQRPWKAGVGAERGEGMPYNAISGKGYSGSNALRLVMEQTMNDYKDDRWLTYKQSQDLGAQVRKGQKGTQLVKWINRDEKSEASNEGPDGAEKSRGSMFPVLFTVFNGDQIDGMPQAQVREIPTEQWRHDKCEELLKDSGANIQHNGGSKAYYRPLTDSIHLPAKEAFETADAYYATALHELGHWTGAKSRLGRDLSGAFGSASYAREELTAEISSWMAGDRLMIGHDPGQHAAYVQHWIQLVKDDPKAILKACTEAEKVCEFNNIVKYEYQAIAVAEQKNEQGHENKPEARRAQDQGNEDEGPMRVPSAHARPQPSPELTRQWENDHGMGM